MAEAVEILLRNGIKGPYALVFGPDQYTGVIQSAEHGGVLLFDHLKKILQGGPIVWAPGVSGRGRRVLARRRLPVRVRPGPRDRLLPPRRASVYLYLEESFSFRVATPEAACALTPPA